MADTNQQYMWRQRKKRNARITIWILFVIAASACGTFAYEGLKESDPQRVAEDYIKSTTGVQEFSVETGERSLNADNQFVQDYTFLYTVDGKEESKTVSLVQKNEKKYALFDQWELQSADAGTVDMDLIVPAGLQVLIDGVSPEDTSVKEDETLSPGLVCYQLTAVHPDSKLQVTGLPFDPYEGTLETSGSSLDVRGMLTVSDNARVQMKEIGKSMVNELYSAVMQGKAEEDLSAAFAQVPMRENLFRSISNNLLDDGSLRVSSIRLDDFEPEFGEVYYPGRDEESFVGIEMKLTYTCGYEPAESQENGDDEAEETEMSESETEAGGVKKEATFYFRYQNGNCVVTSAEVPGVI